MPTRKTLELLRAYESRNITFIDSDGTWPIVWERAQGVHVWDVDGKKYLDLTAAFGVAAAGHANPRVVRAGQQQMGRLLHAMGDVHPHALKAQLARELSRLTFERWGVPASRSRGKVILGNSGFEAVEAALKTAMLATGKAGVLAFEGAYHGLGYGALNATHRDHFRSPFRRQLREFGSFVAFPVETENPQGSLPRSNAAGKSRLRPCATLAETERQIRRRLRQGGIGAILVEPIQVRGGIHIPTPGFLPLLRKLCDEFGALLIVDEIYTGFGRTGRWFACEHSSVVPDLICLGKALTGGFALSACVGKAEVMDAAWPPSTGEAIHTSTFLGHPVGCAMALAQVNELRQADLVRRSNRLGDTLRSMLLALRAPATNLECHARGQGLLAGLELRGPEGRPATKATMVAIKAMLQRGFILLPEGEHANVISFTPPLTISETQLRTAVDALDRVLHELDPV